MLPDPALPRRLSAEARREQIISTAIRLAAEQGVDGVTTQHMADALGLTQGAIFRHFRSKDEIWDAALASIRERLMGALGQAAEQAAEPLAAVEAMFHAHMAFVQAQPAIPRLVFSGYLNRRSERFRSFVEALLDDYRDRIVALLGVAGERGETAAGLDAEAAATLYIGMVQGLVLQATLLGDRCRLDDLARRVFPLFRAAVAATNTPQTP
jgi:AcrR family transcriptional regulator